MAISPQTESSGWKVVQIFELLEAILSLLTMQDLLLSQRTSSRFRDTIKESPKLQRQLFLQPEPPGGQVTFNPLFCILGHQIDHYFVGMPRDAPLSEPTPNFIFEYRGRLLEPGRIVYHPDRDVIVWEYKVRRTKEVHPSFVKSVERTSMGQMLVSQPPKKIYLSGNVTKFHWPARLEVKGGRLCGVLQELEEGRGEWDNQLFDGFTRDQNLMFQRGLD